MFSIENRRAVTFAAYCFGAAFVGCEVLLLVAGAFGSLGADWQPRSFAGHLWSVIQAAVVAALAFVLWAAVGPSSKRARRGLGPIALGALSGWLIPVLFGFGVLIVIRRAPETQMPAFMAEFWRSWTMVFAVMAMNPANWTGLAFGALAGCIYEARVGRVDQRGSDAGVREPASRRAARAVITVATLLSVVIASVLVLRYLSSWDVMFSPWHRARTAAAATAVLLLLVSSGLSWWLFVRRRNAAASVVALISLLLMATSWLHS